MPKPSELRSELHYKEIQTVQRNEVGLAKIIAFILSPLKLILEKLRPHRGNLPEPVGKVHGTNMFQDNFPFGRGKFGPRSNRHGGAQ